MTKTVTEKACLWDKNGQPSGWLVEEGKKSYLKITQTDTDKILIQEIDTPTAVMIITHIMKIQQLSRNLIDRIMENMEKMQ